MTEYLGPFQLGYNETEERGIYHGDARLLSLDIPDESIDLIFCDPIYQRIDDYRWLAETAARVLKPHGVCLIWSNGKWHKKHTDWLEGFGLTYRYDFACIMYGGAAPMNGRIISKTNRLLWFDVRDTSRMIGYLADGYASISSAALFGAFKWTKNPKFCIQAITAFSSNGIVLDPFTGGGTVPAVCKMLGRRYLAFEIEADVCASARQRVRDTQPPLPGLVVEQLDLLPP